jgi:hypothetical protein
VNSRLKTSTQGIAYSLPSLQRLQLINASRLTSMSLTWNRLEMRKEFRLECVRERDLSEDLGVDGSIQLVGC